MKGEKTHYLQNLLDYLKVTASSFAKSIGYDSPNRIYYVLRFRNGISTELANDIINTYKEVNYSWLLTGEGEMLKPRTGATSNSFVGSGNSNVQLGGHGSYFTQTSNQELLNKISELEKELIIKNGEIAVFEEKVKGFEKEVKGLKEQLAVKTEMITFLQTHNKKNSQ